MKNELTTTDTGLELINDDNRLGELIKPLVEEIHLFDTYIAGTSYIKDPSVFEELDNNQRLNLRREENKFDEKAVMILDEKGRKLGYIPEKDNIIFSRLMDAGKLLCARVKSAEKKSKSFWKIAIGIYLVDY